MLKKFVSDALLSVVMDKGARKKLKERQKQKTKLAERPQTSRNPPVLESEEDILSTISDALAEARAEVLGNSSPPPSATAKRTTSPSSPTVPKTASAERQELLKQAMAIHRQKQDVLDDLAPETREKLMIMAMYAIDPNSLPPEARRIAEAENAAAKDAANDLVDDIGSSAPRRRRR